MSLHEHIRRVERHGEDSNNRQHSHSRSLKMAAPVMLATTTRAATTSKSRANICFCIFDVPTHQHSPTMLCRKEEEKSICFLLKALAFRVCNLT